MDDLDLAVLGGGTAGLAAAVLAAGLGARVALIERDRTGGECLWTGCVPSKSLIEAASLAHRMRRADAVGLTPVEPEVDLGRVLERVRQAQAHIEPQDSPHRLRSFGVQVVQDEARLEGAGILRLGSGGRLRTRTVLIATGSEPTLPPVDGLANAGALTTDSIWTLEELPDRLAVLGGGPVGCELAQAFARLGSVVTLIEMAPQLLPGEDRDVGQLIADRLTADGVEVRTGARAERVSDGTVTIRTGDTVDQVGYDRLLVATGRRPRTVGCGLDEAGVARTDGGAVAVDAHMRTTARGVFAAGDVTGVLPFTHVAAYQAAIATLNALFSLRRKASYRSVPWVTFTDPEVARVGLSETAGRRRWGRRTTVAQIGCDRVDRAVAAASTHGFVKLVGDPRGRLAGATVAAPAGGEVIGEFAALIARRAKVGAVYRTVHPYPTFALGAATAGAEHLRTRWLNERTRRVTRPLLAARRIAARLAARDRR